jgi:hypothetical protein
MRLDLVPDRLREKHLLLDLEDERRERESVQEELHELE